MQYVGTYLNITDKVCGEYGRCNTLHHLFRAMTMIMVTNYLRALKPPHLNLKNWINTLSAHFNNSYSSSDAIAYSLGGPIHNPEAITAIHGQQFFTSNYLPETELESLAIYTGHFKPRPIDEALQESNYEDIVENMAFIKLRIGQLSDDEQQEAKKIIQRVTKDTGEKALEGAMPDAAADVRKMMKKVAQEFGESPDEEENDVEMMAVELERVKSELKEYKEKKKGLSPNQAALFGHALAEFCELSYTNKREQLAPMTHKLFGYGESKQYNHMTEGYQSADRETVASIFDGIWPKFAAFVRNTFDKRQNKATPSS